MRIRGCIVNGRRAPSFAYLLGVDWPDRISVALLRAAVKFSTLQSYEFVPSESLLSSSDLSRLLRLSRPPPFILFLRSPSSASNPRACTLSFVSRPLPRASQLDISSSSFDVCTVLYDTRYPSSEILCLAEPRWPSLLARFTHRGSPGIILYSQPASGARTHTYIRRHVRRTLADYIETVVNFNFVHPRPEGNLRSRNGSLRHKECVHIKGRCSAGGSDEELLLDVSRALRRPKQSKRGSLLSLLPMKLYYVVPLNSPRYSLRDRYYSMAP